MTCRFQNISDGDLRETALAIRSGRLSPPYTTVALQRFVSGDVAVLAADLQSLAQSGFSADQVALTLELIQADRQARPPIEDVLDVVTTGPEVSGIANRDTSVVVRELFANARESVLVAGYAVYQGQRVFQTLADRIVEFPGLKVRMFLDIQRGHGDTTMPIELIRRFAERFRASMAQGSTAARGFLRSQVARDRRRAAGIPPCEMRGRRRERPVRVLRQLHGSGPAAQPGDRAADSISGSGEPGDAVFRRVGFEGVVATSPLIHPPGETLARPDRVNLHADRRAVPHSQEVYTTEPRIL